MGWTAARGEINVEAGRCLPFCFSAVAALSGDRVDLSRRLRAGGFKMLPLSMRTAGARRQAVSHTLGLLPVVYVRSCFNWRASFILRARWS